jgi:L-fuculose-phosphate aldolase
VVELKTVGYVRSPLKSLDECPKQYSEGAPGATIEILAEYAEAMNTLDVGRDILIFTWLHQADRDVLTVHPRGDVSRPRRGVFNTRSPVRPNPIGLHFARILEVRGRKIRIDRMEALDGTPVVDIKTAADESRQAENWGYGIPKEVGREFREVCRSAWNRGLLSGFNGNVSVRLGDTIFITRSGAAKGALGPGDLTSIDFESGETTGPGKASIESGMHLEIYRRVPEAGAVFHCHPPRLLAAFLAEGDPAVELPLYEARDMFAFMGRVPGLEPGSRELAEAVGEAAEKYRAVFMDNHGLVARGDSLTSAWALAEELDSLAGIRLLAGPGG